MTNQFVQAITIISKKPNKYGFHKGTFALHFFVGYKDQKRRYQSACSSYEQWLDNQEEDTRFVEGLIRGDWGIHQEGKGLVKLNHLPTGSVLLFLSYIYGTAAKRIDLLQRVASSIIEQEIPVVLKEDEYGSPQLEPETASAILAIYHKVMFPCLSEEE